MITGLNPSDSNPYSSIKDSNLNVVGLSQECPSLVSGNPWRNPYSNPYVYDAAAAVALVGYGPYAAGYSAHMDLAGRRKNATRETTATLKAWLYEHRKNPYPTKSEKVYLAIMTKMTLTQVSTWFANARRRLKKENKMTWSPRNRTNDDDDDDDDDRQIRESNSDQSDDEFTPTANPTSSSLSSSSTTTTNTNTTIAAAAAAAAATQSSFIPYFSPSLSILQHQQIHVEQFNRKRKSDENENQQQRKKSTGIWSLADMAEKNDSNKINQSKHDSPSASSASSSASTSPISSSQSQTLVGAFKPFK